ncbi:hypothetical protein DBR29_23190 [Pseudomonas sp. HMWF005]|nr:hypothetical protein DBR29_23190 [Pseudomonas sp. HMWF005]
MTGTQGPCQSGQALCCVIEDAIAGKPAPTGFCGVPIIEICRDPCGSWLASDSYLEGNTETSVLPRVFRRSPAD